MNPLDEIVEEIVVIGNGMVGSRFAHDLLSLAPTSKVTVLGAEPYEPYNRVLLSDVVAGRTDLAGIHLPAKPHPNLQVLPGRAAVRVDRACRQVIDELGASHLYDHLVFATGADASVPQVAGLTENLPAVHVLRDLDDARRLLAASGNARRAAVLGAGVLGLEIATGLAGRGLEVTLIGRGRVMDRQLDDLSAEALTQALGVAGVQVAHPRSVALQANSGRLTALVLDDTTVPIDLLVIAAGTRARTRLAEAAGLSVARGIVVNDHLSSPDDPRVHAIGDCAQPPEGASGLVAQGWDQARRLATRLAGLETSDAAPSLTPSVVKVKSERVQAVAMGVRGADRATGERRLRLSDPDAGRHVEVIVRGDTLLGAVVIGDPAIAADLTAAFTRGTPLPDDPAHLLVKTVPGQAKTVDSGSLTRLPDRAAICRCNGVTKGDLVRCWHEGHRNLESVASVTRATTGCGTCAETICDLLAWVERSSGEAPEGSDGEKSATRPKHSASKAVTEAS